MVQWRGCRAAALTEDAVTARLSAVESFMVNYYSVSSKNFQKIQQQQEDRTRTSNNHRSLPKSSYTCYIPHSDTHTCDLDVAARHWS